MVRKRQIIAVGIWALCAVVLCVDHWSRADGGATTAPTTTYAVVTVDGPHVPNGTTMPSSTQPFTISANVTCTQPTNTDPEATVTVTYGCYAQLYYRPTTQAAWGDPPSDDTAVVQPINPPLSSNSNFTIVATLPDVGYYQIAVSGSVTVTSTAATQPTVYVTQHPTYVYYTVAASFEMIDAQGFKPDDGGSLTRNVTGPPASGQNMIGAWADGTSVLVLRLQPILHVPEPVTFKIRHNETGGSYGQYKNDSSMVGSLADVMPDVPAADGDSNGSTKVTVDAGDPKVIFYRPPNDFWFRAEAEMVKLELDVTHADGTPFIDKNGNPIRPTIELHRPEVMLSHGFNSGPGSMSGIKDYLTAQCPDLVVDLFDWHDINISGVDVAATRLFHRMQSDIDAARSKRIAASRIDYAAHSAGGVLCRFLQCEFPSGPRNRGDWGNVSNWNSLPFYFHDNLGAGYVHRIVTSDTPYQGSPWGTYLVDHFPMSFVAQGFQLGGASGTGDILWDFQPGKIDLDDSYPPQRVPLCPIHCSAATQPIGDLSSGMLSSLITIVNDVFGISGQLGFTGDNSDWIVFLTSQTDGTNAGSKSFYSPAVHTNATQKQTVQRYESRVFDIFFEVNPGDLLTDLYNQYGYTMCVGGG